MPLMFNTDLAQENENSNGWKGHFSINRSLAFGTPPNKEMIFPAHKPQTRKQK